MLFDLKRKNYSLVKRKCLILILKECRKYALFRAYWQESVTIL